MTNETLIREKLQQAMILLGEAYALLPSPHTCERAPALTLVWDSELKKIGRGRYTPFFRKGGVQKRFAKIGIIFYKKGDIENAERITKNNYDRFTYTRSKKAERRIRSAISEKRIQPFRFVEAFMQVEG